MKILFAASEATPFVKTGGLGEVVGSLPGALNKLGADVRVILPKYGDIPQKYKDKMRVIKRFSIRVGNNERFCGVEHLQMNNKNYYFIDNEQFFKRPGLYGYWDDGERFAFYSRAVLESLPHLQFKPDIIHCHDWQAAMINVLLKAQYEGVPFYKNIAAVFTIHNLKFQGIFPRETLELFHLGGEHFHPDALEYYGNVNYLKGGIAYADVFTTVSRTYAEEIKSPFFGEGLDGFIRKNEGKLVGILNGIDYDEYDPSKDPHIFKNYDSNSLRERIENKYKLQKLLNLPVTNKVPLLSMVSRLTSQKGLDLIKHVLNDLLAKDIQMVILGTGDSIYEEMFRKAEKRYTDKLSVNILFDDKLARRIYAGADIFLMPSLFEPCGLGQLIAMRYGNVPVVRETGGLNDTVYSYNEETGEGNGFSFTNYNAHDMLYTIGRAVSYFHNKPVWTKIRKTAMKMDFSWNKSAEEYMELYNRVLSSKGGK